MLDYSELLTTFQDRIKLFIAEVEMQERHIRALIKDAKNEKDAISSSDTMKIADSDPLDVYAEYISNKFNTLKVSIKELKDEELNNEKHFRENKDSIIQKFTDLMGIGDVKNEKSYNNIINDIVESVQEKKFNMDYVNEFKKHNENFMKRNEKFLTNIRSKINSDRAPTENEIKEGISVPHDLVVFFMKHPENDKIINRLMPIKAMKNFSMTDIISDKMYEVETGLDFLVNEDTKEDKYWNDLLLHKNVISVDNDYVTGEDDDAESNPGKMKTQTLYNVKFPKKEE